LTKLRELLAKGGEMRSIVERLNRKVSAKRR
jgi:hypothetical protein